MSKIMGEGENEMSVGKEKNIMMSLIQQSLREAVKKQITKEV